MSFLTKTGLITGRQHLIYGINCQDSLATKTFQHQKDTYYIGVVTDGCGEGARSEVGAHLASSFLLRQMESMIRHQTLAQDIPGRLFADSLEYLETVISGFTGQDDAPAERVAFIKDHLLFTVLGFYVTPSTTIIYALGDGVVLLNDLVDIRDEQNHPNYIAYHLVGQDFLSPDRSPLPNKFDLYQIPTSQLFRLAVGTDAWGDELGVLFSIFNDRLSKSVQRTMNLLSKKEHKFKDDAAIVMLEKSKEASHESES